MKLKIDFTPALLIGRIEEGQIEIWATEWSWAMDAGSSMVQGQYYTSTELYRLQTRHRTPMIGVGDLRLLQ